MSPSPAREALRDPWFALHGSEGARPAPRSVVILLVALLLGCATPPPMAELTLVTTREGALTVVPLRSRVRGEWCFSENVVAATLRPPWRARLANHGLAIRRAIESVPGADVLINVSIDVRVEQYLLFQRICAIATGDAASVP